MTISTTAADKRQGKSLLWKIAAALFWVAAWAILSRCVGQELLVPSPAQVIVRLSQLLRETDFWRITAGSLLRIMCGYLAAVAAGVGLAVLTYAVPFLHALVSPLMGIIKATPVASFIILALVWLRGSHIPPFAAFLMVLPIVWGNVGEGLRNTDAKLLEMARVFRLGPWKTAWRIYAPSVLPYFMAGCTTGLGLAWKAGVAAEVLAMPRNSIGLQLYNAKVYLETTDLFAWTLVIIALSMLLEKLLVGLLHCVSGRFFRPLQAAKEGAV